MSANPSAFEWVRTRAYRFADKNGKGPSAMGHFCYDTMQEWRATDPEGANLSESEGAHIAQAVANWVCANYNPRRKPPKSTAAQRDFDRDSLLSAMEMVNEFGAKPSARNVAAFAGYSKSKAARLMKNAGVAPRRSAKAEALSAPAQRLFKILEWNTPDFRPIVTQKQALIDYVWPQKPGVQLSKSNKSNRKKRFAALISEISKAGLGYHLLDSGEAIVARTDRRWKRLDEAALYVDDRIRSLQVHRPYIPVDPEVAGGSAAGLFYQQPEIQLCLNVLRLMKQYDFRRTSDADPVLQLMGKSPIDPNRIRHAVAKAIAHGSGCVLYLFRLQEFRWNADREFAKEIARFAKISETFFPAPRSDWHSYAYDILHQAFFVSGYLDRLQVSDPSAALRVQDFLDGIRDGEKIEEALPRLEQYERDELEAFLKK